MSKEMLELADEIEYCVERGIDAHLTAKSLTIISAALRAYAVAEPVAEMTIDSIEQRYKAWRGDLTVFERPSHQDAFREGYVAGWNDRESFHPAPAAPIPASVREALEDSQSLLVMINHLGSDRLTGIASLDWDNEDLSKLTAEQIAENRSALASLPAPEAAPTPDLTDPNVVHANMLRGTIAKPTWEQIKHLYPEQAAAPTLTADFTKALPGGTLDNSTYEQIETALDRADAPMTDKGRFMTLFERIAALGAERDAALSPAAPTREEIAREPGETAPKDGRRLILFWEFPDLPMHFELGWWKDGSWRNTYGLPFSGDPHHWFDPAILALKSAPAK